MKWFKHLSDSHNDPDLEVAVATFGIGAYAVFWILLEMYAKEFEHSVEQNHFILRLSWFQMQNKTRMKRKRLERILDYFAERGRIKWSREGHAVLIEIPKFIEVADEYTQRLVTRQKAKVSGQVSGQTPSQEVEVDLEVDKDQDQVIKVIFECDRFKITDEQNRIYQEAYPDVDLTKCYKEMVAWLISRPLKWQKRPLQGVNTWLRGEQRQHDGFKKTADLLKAGKETLGMPVETKKPKPKPRVRLGETLIEQARWKVRKEKEGK